MRTAVVTGASSGIGEACACLLARSGWDVFLVARRRDRLDKIAANTNAHIIELDITKATEEDFQQVKKCDLLVNCAGGAFGIDFVAESNADDWTKMYNVNVLGTLRMIQILLSRLVESQGCIINITSTAALSGYEGGSGYCAAKSAQRALTQSLRLEMKGKPVRITELLPGMVYTPEFSLNRLSGNADKANAIYKDVDRPLRAEDIAQIVSMVANLPSHVNVDELTVRPVAQRSQYALFRGDLNWKH
ncbi:SDR family oxidoreductase [Halomonas sp. ISL-60]|uniref:SDR family oxidoreductase n=1 Tax=Halomonas sp. ISL-56 TaxID=2819149 RepID=UPI001BE6E5AA|nr:SDR family oxidoreductase [Halomonas sp. ISL-56]MBT2772731.1 SDR family oxidoreductase [Halomonas sp. ISL-60]MBT2800526.1 SDR family oxidoreductase [Halomonas sp. ISL-56]